MRFGIEAVAFVMIQVSLYVSQSPPWQAAYAAFLVGILVGYDGTDIIIRALKSWLDQRAAAREETKE